MMGQPDGPARNTDQQSDHIYYTLWLQVREESRFKIATIFWQPAATYFLNMAISGEKILQNIWQLWHILFTKILCMSCIRFSFVTKWQNFTGEKKCCS
jgi:hypothetical protein